MSFDTHSFLLNFGYRFLSDKLGSPLIAYTITTLAMPRCYYAKVSIILKKTSLNL